MRPPWRLRRFISNYPAVSTLQDLKFNKSSNLDSGGPWLTQPMGIQILMAAELTVTSVPVWI